MSVHYGSTGAGRSKYIIYLLVINFLDQLVFCRCSNSFSKFANNSGINDNNILFLAVFHIYFKISCNFQDGNKFLLLFIF